MHEVCVSTCQGMELTDAQLESIIQKEFDRRDKDKDGTLSVEGVCECVCKLSVCECL